MIKQENSRFRYLILATATLKQGLLANVLAERFPKERGRIFLPEREYWIRKTHLIGTKPPVSRICFCTDGYEPEGAASVCEGALP